jgi:hypothetical protein
MLCTGCNGENGQDHRFCVYCGIPLQESPSTSKLHRKAASVTQKSDSDPDQKTAPISAAAIIALFAMVFLLTGADLRTIPALLLLFFPLIVGELIFLRRSEKPVAMMQKFEVWAEGKRETGVRGSSFPHACLFDPFFRCLTSAMQKAESITNPHLRAGVIISASLYIAGFIAYVTVAIAVAIISTQ